METIYSVKPLVAVLVSLLAAPVIASARRPNLREGWTFLAGGIKLVVVASMLPAVLEGQRLVFSIAEVLPGIPLVFRVDALGLLFALVSSSLWIVTSIYSIGYMRGLDEHGQSRYYTFFAVALSATLGVAFAGNLLTLYLFYEMLSFATYPLVTHHQDPEAQRSGRKYLTFIVGSSIGLLLPAMVITYLQTGTLEFAQQGFMAGHVGPGLTAALLFMMVFGFAKAGVMPFHVWLPAAMVAPTPVSALLHAVAVVKVGAFSIVRVITCVFGVDHLAALGLGTILGYVASATILIGSLIAMSQDELKRRLAFSTISQLSYIILGASLLVPAALLGGTIHIAMHAFGKITLFMCAGAIYVATHTKHISGMVGIGRRMPWTMACFFVGAMSVIGLPPTGGFLSKWNLLIGTLDAHQTFFLVVLLVSSLLNAGYFLPIVYRAFFVRPSESLWPEGVKEAPRWCLVPPLITATITVGLFFYPQPFLALARLAVYQVTGVGTP